MKLVPLLSVAMTLLIVSLPVQATTTVSMAGSMAESMAKSVARQVGADLDAIVAADPALLEDRGASIALVHGLIETNGGPGPEYCDLNCPDCCGHALTECLETGPPAQCYEDYALCMLLCILRNVTVPPSDVELAPQDQKLQVALG